MDSTSRFDLHKVKFDLRVWIRPLDLHLHQCCQIRQAQREHAGLFCALIAAKWSCINIFEKLLKTNRQLFKLKNGFRNLTMLILLFVDSRMSMWSYDRIDKFADLQFNTMEAISYDRFNITNYILCKLLCKTTYLYFEDDRILGSKP